MEYVFRLTIPANTPKSSPERLNCQLTHGIINHVSVCFPPKKCNLAHLVIYRFEHQVWPTNPEESFAWDDYTIEFDEEFELLEWPYTMSIRGWNEDDTYEHTITVRFEIGGRKWGLADLLAMTTPITRLEE